MKTRILSFLMLFFAASAFAQDAFPHPDYYFPTPVQSSDGNNGSCVALIYIDGVRVETEAELEVAFFDEDGNCRQRDFVHNWGSTYGYQFQSVIYGENGQPLTFKFYNHELGKSSDELGYVCLTSFVYQTSIEFGVLTNPEHVYFEKPSTCTFTNEEGNSWSNPANWSGNSIPTAGSNAIIAENQICIVEDGDEIAFATLTIKNGAQFYDENENEYENVTIEKSIEAYTPGQRNGYYLISNPTDGSLFETGTLTTGNYDLYFFLQDGKDEDENAGYEWQNYESSMYDEESFIAPYNGYLYANAANSIISFTGTINFDGASYKRLPMTDGVSFPGFNLVGNPLPCNAFADFGNKISGIYVMNENRNEIISLDEFEDGLVMAPCTAMFAVASANESTSGKVAIAADPDYFEEDINVRHSHSSRIGIEVNNENGLLDRSCIRFSDRDNLQKFTLNPEATHIFFREEGKDYAIVQGNERMSQLPLFFETREYGQYTINVKLENLTCEYLHLIDNLTGMDVDLLATPSYTFQANSSDYACRFKLVFEGTGVEENNATENFAIVEGNRIVIPVIEHESTLEVIDMTGRTVSSQKVNGSFDQTLNVKAGLYILNLNGMIQKIVVE